MCIFNKKEWLFLNEDKVIIQIDYKQKNYSAYKIWKDHQIHPKNGSIPLLSAYWKNFQKLV